jgi:hypothetical protein
MNWHGGDVTVNVGPQHEHRFDDGDHITVHTASGSGQFQVTGTVLLAGQHAALFIQAGEVG